MCIFVLGASVMRHFLILILVFGVQASIAQWKLDTTISKRTLDSLHHELARHKDASKRTYFRQIVAHNSMKVDSFFTINNDTLTIINYSKTNKPLRTQEIHFDKAGCKSLLIEMLFDTTGLRIYQEQWKLGCDWENDITGFLQYRYRYHYDQSKNEIGMTTESFDGGGHRVRYFEYKIDTNGKKSITKSLKLSEYSFWD